ncbi:MAG: glutamine--fructose-6-phosphate transaminase (isomerizing) [Candidatus Omnitrophota bacterium]
MCGIVGYIGQNEAVNILLSGLKKLEYRGYDSAGIATVVENKIQVRKTKGKIDDLARIIEKKPFLPSHIGIAHTRWATHGAPNNLNAHPHFSCDKKISVVHNGIIENYMALKKDLMASGHRFVSETDTEVLAHLIEKHYQGNLKNAVMAALKVVRGSFALGVVCSDEPDKIVAARKDSPLIVAHDDKGWLIASDVPAILEHCHTVLYLKDGEVAVLKKNGLELYGLNGKILKPKFDKVTMDAESAKKNGYAHFMLKEIFEQPAVLKKILGRGFNNAAACRLFHKKISRIVVIACGTAYHAGLAGKYIIESLARVPVWVDFSSEFRYRHPLIDKNTLVIAVSQSGETADTLAAAREAKKRGASIIAICNVAGSSLTRESDCVFYTLAGPEIGVASTKAYTAQLAVFYLFGLELAFKNKKISSSAYKNYLKILARVPAQQAEILKASKDVAKIARRHCHFGSFLFLGRNINFPTALEGALKLKEISYIPAEGYAAGEMKHGPIALIDEYRAVVCIATVSKVYDKMVSNIQEIKARAGKLIVIATKGDSVIKHHSKEVVYVPKIDELFSPLLTVLPLQLLAYYIALARGCNVDQPRNLAKSVTVE